MLHICVMFYTLPCKVEEEYGLFIPILHSDYTLRITREEFLIFLTESLNF